MARWTVRQEEILREHGHRGVDAVRKMIAEECGVVHSPHAIQMHAHRIRASLREQKVCPECGAVGAPLNLRTGLCPKCTAFQHVEEQAVLSELLAEERMQACAGADLDEARKEYDALRQRNSRFRRKHGLGPKRCHRRGQGGPDGDGAGDL